MMQSGLELRGIRKAYGETVVVDDVSLDVADGEMLVLVGPSGSGKSTLLRIIAGLVDHDAGEIRIGGNDVGHLPPARRDAAMVFQSYALFPHMTIAENLSFGMRARRVPRNRVATRISEVAETLRLTSLLQRYPSELSGGERQRVALGRAMLREPKLFLMDEPLSSLDAQLRVHTRAEIVRLHERLKTTTVYVTHDQIEALSMGDRIGVLNQGRLQQLGTPNEVYERPASLFVARFIGTPAMNTLPVQSTAPGQVVWNGSVVELPPRFHAAWRQPAERPLVLGVRPEHIYLQGSRWAHGRGSSSTIKGKVDIVEMAGDQIFLELDVNGTLLVVRAEPDLKLRRGDDVEFWFDRDALHLFDPETERAMDMVEQA